MIEFDKTRIYLKPSQNWNEWIKNAFQFGRCECIRCRESNYDESAYRYKHTFEIDGEILSRRFATTPKEDFESNLKKAWISFYRLDNSKEEIFIKHFYDTSHSLLDIYEFTLPELKNKLVALIPEIRSVELSGNLVEISRNY